MRNIELLRLQLNHLVTQARNDLYILATMNDSPYKNQILQRLWETISSIEFLIEYLASLASLSSTQPTMPIPTDLVNEQIQPVTPSPDQPLPDYEYRIFTTQELATYDGKNGRPAFVAVNNLVYDVTNDSAWAAATHFGLEAGKDYTNEFASCHQGQLAILAALPVVGRLA